MHAPRMLPLLASVLAMPISRFIPILLGPSGIDVIIMLVLDMLSLLQLIIFADADDDRAHTIAALRIAIFRMVFSSRCIASENAGPTDTVRTRTGCSRSRFIREDFNRLEIGTIACHSSRALQTPAVASAKDRARPVA